MEFSSRKYDHVSTINIAASESELRRLTQSERDLVARLASAQTAARAAHIARQGSLIDGAALKESAIRGAEEGVSDAEVLVRKLEDELASVRRDRETVQQRLTAACDQTHRLDEAAALDLFICEIVDALKAFERASERLAFALDGSRAKAAQGAPFIAASLRIAKTRFATEARDVLSEIEAYRAGLLDGSVKLLDPASAQVGNIEREHTGAHQFTAEPMLSIIPAPVPSPDPVTGAMEEEPRIA